MTEYNRASFGAHIAHALEHLFRVRKPIWNGVNRECAISVLKVYVDVHSIETNLAGTMLIHFLDHRFLGIIAIT